MQLSKEGMTLESYNDFPEIKLTDDQMIEALRNAREKEYYRRRAEEYRKTITSVRATPKFNHGQLIEFFKMQYEIDETNERVIYDLCYYFSDNIAFSGDLQKGLLLSGGVGVGKTTIMKFFMRNQIFSYRVTSCREVEQLFSEDGYDAVDKFSANQPIALNGNPFGQQIVGFCFDDLGTESNSKHFGKEKNMMAEIILNRYDSKLPFNSTHITTNLTAEDLKENYGTRVTDRLREMVNVITFDKNIKSRR